jgi:hypothetical protein
MAYACACNVSGYSGFFDEFQKIARIALPTVGGLKGLTAGYDQDGIWGAVKGALGGVAQGYQSLTPPPPPPRIDPPPQQVKSPTGVPMMPSGYDSLLGPETQVRYTYYTPAPAPQQPTNIVLPAPQTTQAEIDRNKILFYGGLGLGAVLLIAIITR